MAKRKVKVHGLYVVVPLRDYHLAYILKGLKLLREEHASRGLPSVKFIDGLTEHIRKYFSELIRQTKIYRRFIDHHTLTDIPPIKEMPIPEPTVYKDPEYNIRKNDKKNSSDLHRWVK